MDTPLTQGWCPLKTPPPGSWGGVSETWRSIINYGEKEQNLSDEHCTLSKLDHQIALKDWQALVALSFPWALTQAGRSWHTWGAPQCCSAGGICSHTSGSGSPGKAASGRNRRRPTWRRSSLPVNSSVKLVVYYLSFRTTFLACLFSGPINCLRQIIYMNYVNLHRRHTGWCLKN